MASKRKPPARKQVTLIYEDPRYAGDGEKINADQWAECVIGFTHDGATLRTAGASVEQYTAEWLIYLATSELVGLWEPPVVVIADGLDYATDRRKCRIWQVKGMALLEAARLTESSADLARVVTTDYRVQASRVMRTGSASCERARRWCEAYDRGQAKAQDYTHAPDMVHDLGAAEPSPPRDPEAEALAFYRELLVSGEVES